MVYLLAVINALQTVVCCLTSARRHGGEQYHTLKINTEVTKYKRVFFLTPYLPTLPAPGHLGLLHAAVLTDPQLFTNPAVLAVNVRDKLVNLFVDVAIFGILPVLCLPVNMNLVVLVQVPVDNDTLDLGRPEVAGRVLVDDHALVLELLPQAAVVVQTEAEVARLQAVFGRKEVRLGQELDQILERRREGGALPLGLVRQQRTPAAHRQNVQVARA